jgi:acetyl esterase
VQGAASVGQANPHLPLIRRVATSGKSLSMSVLPFTNFQGAGWVMGDTTTHGRLVRQLAVGTHAGVIFVDCNRSPEVRYPVANAVTKYVAEHSTDFNVDASRLAIAGDSVGYPTDCNCPPQVISPRSFQTP